MLSILSDAIDTIRSLAHGDWFVCINPDIFCSFQAFIERIVHLLTVLLSIVPQSTLRVVQQSNHSIPASPRYTVAAEFPLSAFSSYYIKPAATQEPQPIIFDYVLNTTFPLNLTNPKTIPNKNENDPVYFPLPIVNISLPAAEALVRSAFKNISAIVKDNSTDNCTKCLAALSVGKVVAQKTPESVPALLVNLCSTFNFRSSVNCMSKYATENYGVIWAQVLAFANVSGLDGRYICNDLSKKFCPGPLTSPLNKTGLFPKPKPTNARIPLASGERVKVLHLSDFHLDPRYLVTAEANCSRSLCCRADTNASAMLYGQIAFPAPLYGAYKCDTPYYLALAALQAISPLTGTDDGISDIAWTIYTGDLVSHDPQNQLSRAYIEYTETSVYSLFKKYLGGPVFAALGNHDSNPNAIDAPHSLPGPLGRQSSWNYNHVASLWQQNGWINSSTVEQARLHYGAYSVRNQYGLRIITLNTDFWLKGNSLNYINTTDPDVSGMLRFLIEELQAAEDAKERVWILGHVLSGWDGKNPLKNPTDLFYTIVDRYSPHVIANIFFGHTVGSLSIIFRDLTKNSKHEDQVMIYYSQNGTVRTSSTAQTIGWIGPSITPLTNLNSGFRMYEVDTGSFEIYEAYTWISDVSSYSDLNVSATGPVFELEYSTRDAYNIGWPSSSALNAQYWHTVTEAMETDRSLVERFNTYQGKSSIRTPNCTNDACAEAKICYMRSGSAPLGKQCIQGRVLPPPLSPFLPRINITNSP